VVVSEVAAKHACAPDVAVNPSTAQFDASTRNASSEDAETAQLPRSGPAHSSVAK
jgi:hypothetical protein